MRYTSATQLCLIEILPPGQQKKYGYKKAPCLIAQEGETQQKLNCISSAGYIKVLLIMCDKQRQFHFFHQ